MPTLSTSFLHEKSNISYHIVFSARKTLAIQVYPDGKILVRAPKKTTMNLIKASVDAKVGWIMKQQRKFESLPEAVATRKYISGEMHYYLGQPYLLKISQGSKEKIKIYSQQLHIETRQPKNVESIQKRLRVWYRAEAQRIFTQRYFLCVQQIANIGIEHELGINIRRMSRRWGSCNHQGKITLSLNLIATPEECIDYVILHELCHLKEFNHSAKFYQLLSRVAPDWKQKRQQLNAMAAIYYV